jgi:hypothetical protein
MMFGLGCCCNISTGIYDFWALGGANSSVGDFLDNYTIISRMPSNQPKISGYLNETTIEGSLSPTRNSSVITSYKDGLYMNVWNSGDYPFPSFGPNPISMNLIGEERLWAYYFTTTGNSKVDYFNHQSISGAESIKTVGTGAYITGEFLVLNTDAPTSGCYVRWDFPSTPNVFTNGIDFDIPYLFDKTLLTTIQEYHKDTKTEYWYKPSNDPGFDEGARAATYIYYQSGIALDSGIFPNFSRSQYVTGLGDTNEWVYITYPPIHGEFSGSGLKAFEIRLVDNVSGYILDDISGFSLQIRNLRFPYRSQTGITSNIPMLAYIDPVNKSVLSQILLTGAYYSGLTDLDCIKYASDYSRFSNNARSSHFSLDLFSVNPNIFNTNSIFRNNQCLFENSSSTQSGSVVVARLLNNNTYDNIGFGSSGNSITSNGRVSIPEFSTYFSTFDPIEEYESIYENEDKRAGYVESADPIDWFLAPYASWAVDHYNAPFGVLPDNYYVDDLQLIPILSSDGTEQLYYNSSHRHWIVEQDVPVTEKINFYQNYLYARASGNDPINWNALDINNFNGNTTNLPKICHITERDAPNCFSVLLPKENFIHTTGVNGVSNQQCYPTGLLSQTVRILYGPIKQSSYTISTISGKNLNLGNAIRSDFTGIGGTRPNGTFNYFTSRTGLVSGGKTYDFTIDFAHGDEDGEIFWEDTFEQVVPYHQYNVAYTESSRLTYTGLYESSNTLNCTANVLRGDKHLPTNTLAACFVHSYNHWNSGISMDGRGVSGECYAKLKIGNNIVFDKPIYSVTNTNFGLVVPTIGPYALHATEANQRSNMTGKYAAFVWFERLDSVEGYRAQFATGTATATGWKMHVSDNEGNDLWTISTSGHRHWELGNEPTVQDSSDRFFYVNEFFMPYPNSTFNNDYTYSADGSGIYVWPELQFSGAGISWGFSHDGSSIIPGGVQRSDIIGPTNLPVLTFPSGTPHNTLNYLWGFSIKNSDLLDSTPSLTAWPKASGFLDARYYIITGTDPYFPSGIPPDISTYPSPHMLVSTTGFDMSQYPDYNYIYSGIQFIELLTEEGFGVELPYYIASGITGQGWL